jgi:hypothetical protein
VYKRKRNGRFEAFPVFNGKKHYIGAYDTAEEAAMVVARFCISKGESPPANKIAAARPQNPQVVQLQCTVQQTEELVTPVNDSAVKPTEPVVTTPAVPEPVIDLSHWRSDACNSGYQGVYSNKNTGKFEASFKKQYLGAYDTAEEAAMVVARATISKAISLPTSSEVPAVVATQISQTLEHNTVTPNAEVEVAEAVAEGGEWQGSGHPWTNRRVLRLFGDQKVSGVVTSWIPASTADLTAVDPALFHVVHDDGECS